MSGSIAERIGSGRALVIAETASSHEGDVGMAKSLADTAKAAGADAVKYQIISFDDLFVKSHPGYARMKPIEFSEHEWKEILRHARSIGLLVLADAFDSRCLSFSDMVDGFKIPSSSLSETGLVRAIADTKKPVLLGTGGSKKEEIVRALESLGRKDGTFLVVGFQSFPTPLSETNLKQIRSIGEEFGLPVGFADHTDAGAEIALYMPALSVASGAALVEKHITLDRSKKGRDHYSSLNPDEFKKMVSLVRETEQALGDGSTEVSGSEAEYAAKMKKFVVASVPIKAGQRITADMITFKRTPEPGCLPYESDRIIGSVSKRDYSADETITRDGVARAAVLIAVRMKSARLPKKALADLNGKPVIEQLIHRVRTARLPASVVLATSTHPDDSVLLDIARESGIAGFAGSEDDVLDRFINAAEEVDADIIVRVTGDNPLVDPFHIDRMVMEAATKGADYVRVEGLPVGTRPEVMTLKALKKAHEMADNPEKSEYMTLYFTQPGAFKVETVSADPDCRMPECRLALDVPEDLEVLRKIFGKFPDSSSSRLADILAFLKENPEIMNINAGFQPREVSTGKSGEKIRIDGD